MDKFNRRLECWQCYAKKHQSSPHPPLSTLPPLHDSPPPPLVSRPDGCIDSLTQGQREYIITLWKEGMSRNDIADKIHCSLNTVGHWIREWQQHHSLEEKEKSGQPRCTTAEVDEQIEQFADEKKFVTPRDLRRELQLPCSARTLRRRLDEVNLFGRIAREADEYDERILTLRLSFANGFKHFTDEDWDTVIFSDEVHFCLGHHGQVWVQRPPGKAYDPQYCKPAEKELYKITLWGCFCSKGIGAGRIFIGELNKQLYCDILAHNLMPTYKLFYPSGVWRYVQDNASPHYNSEVNTWMHNHGIHVIEFPPRSPDLNPIENIWHILKWRVEHRNPRTAEEFEQIIGEEYEAIEQQTCVRLAHSMHARLLDVIQFQGHKTKY